MRRKRRIRGRTVVLLLLLAAAALFLLARMRLFPLIEDMAVTRVTNKTANLINEAIDEQIRKGAVDYSSMRTGNTITLQIKNRSEDTFFMLRLHNEEIEDIDGAAAEKIEDGAYLITPERDTVTISLKK